MPGTGRPSHPSPDPVLSPAPRVSMETPLCLLPGLPLVRTALATFSPGGGTVLPSQRPLTPTHPLPPHAPTAPVPSRRIRQQGPASGVAGPGDCFPEQTLGCLLQSPSSLSSQAWDQGPLVTHTLLAWGEGQGCWVGSTSQGTVATACRSVPAERTLHAPHAPTLQAALTALRGPLWFVSTRAEAAAPVAALSPAADPGP